MSQRGLGSFGVDVHPDEMLGDARDWITGLSQSIQSTIDGIAPDWWGRMPEEVSGELWVYQYVVAYSKGSLRDGYEFDAEEGKRPARTGSASPEVQFKVGIYVRGEPTADLENRLREHDVFRLVTAFDTGNVYGGYMSGFGFERRRTYVQREQVSAREVEQKGFGLGVPWFEVEAYDENAELQGFADGFFDPFTKETEERVTQEGEDWPGQEVWRVRDNLNTSRSVPSWEIGAEAYTEGSKRVRNIRGKDVYIGPFHIGTVTKRGTTWLRREYSGSGKYTDKATITSQSGIPPQALQSGTKLYKYRETEGAIHLSTTEPPAGFRPADPDDIRPSQTGRKTTVEEVTKVLLEPGEPTRFEIQTDESRGRLLGLYNPPVTRDIEYETRLVHG